MKVEPQSSMGVGGPRQEEGLQAALGEPVYCCQPIWPQPGRHSEIHKNNSKGT